MTIEHNDHHLLLGETQDYLTGEIIADTHDERYRQKIARMLVTRFGYEKTRIKKDCDLIVRAGRKKSKIKVDFLIRAMDARGRERTAMIIKYSPGSLVTRRQSCIALSRIIAPYQVPIAVMTNGEDAEIIDGTNGDVIAQGLENLPDQDSLDSQVRIRDFPPLPGKIQALATRIVHACEIDGACPCDTDICHIE